MSILIRAQALTGYPELVRQRGGDPQTLLARHGLANLRLDDSRAFVAYHSFMALLEDTATELGVPEFGLDLSQYQDIGVLGLIGLFLQQSTNLRAFYTEGVTTMPAHNQGEDWDLRVDNGLASLCRHERSTAVLSNRQGRELAIGVALRIIRQLVGENWKPRWVSFVHGPASAVSTYRKFLRTPVRFNQEFDGLVFDASDLDKSLAASNEQIREMLGQYLSDLELKHFHDTSEQVRTLIRHSINHEGCNLDNMARLMALSPRTLQRRLAERGDTFKSLLNEVRIEVACKFLKESTIPLSQLSMRLGYTEASAFTRAFRQQTGMTPRDWRKENRIAGVKR